MSSNTKNIGQVVGLFISTVPPSNTTLIWYDETPNQCCHKVYNPTTKLWQALNPDIISITTYSELVNNAKKNGLSVGKKYQIRDKSGVLATVITPTKIQYVDTLGNILIDDLGTNVQYHVSSSNIFIDDVNGVLNSSNQLIFSFTDSTPNFETDYFFGKMRVGAKWVLSKFSLNKFLSKTTGNSISWKNGFFFNFSDAIRGILDKTGGVVSKNSYDKKMRELEAAITNVSKENQNIISDASKAVTDATADAAIYDKKLPINIDTTIAPGDIQRLDSLATIVSKVQRWILKFKYATGIRLSRSFADAKSMQYINSNDTVESAFGKVQYYLKHPAEIGGIDGVENLSEDYYDGGSFPEDFAPEDNDTILSAFAKIRAFFLNIIYNIRLSSTFKPKDYGTNVELPKANDSLDEAFAKAVAKFNQIGLIYNGVIESRQRNTADNSTTEGTPKMRLDLNQGIVTLRGNGSATATTSNKKDFVQITPSQIRMGNDDDTLGNSLNIQRGTFEYRGNSSRYYNTGTFLIKGANGYSISVSAAFLSNVATALSAKNSRGYEYGYYDAFFGNMKVGGLVLDAIYAESDVNISANTSMVLCNSDKGETITVYLPENPESGRIVFILRGGNGNVNVQARGDNGIDKIGSSISTIAIGSRGQVYMFVFNRSVTYSGESPQKHGLWGYSVLPH